jgi:hypothetical protein
LSKIKQGLIVGAFSRLDMYRFLSIQPGIYFAMKGAKYDFPGSGGKLYVVWHLLYKKNKTNYSEVQEYFVFITVL